MNVTTSSVPERCVQTPDVRPGKAVKTKLLRAKALLQGKMRLPYRPLRNLSRTRLCAYLFWSVVALAGALYGAWSDKAPLLGVKDRRLNTFGRTGSVLVTVLSLPIALFSFNELWVREGEED